MKFIDEAKIEVIAGDGGAGSASMRREKFIEFGGPDGGDGGRGGSVYGRAGDEIELRMPVGTIITDFETGDLIADLTKHGERLCLADGGVGGWGNIHFKSSTNRAPRQKTNGKPGVRRKLKLELKVLADVGLLGMPNAGKSTLITAVSNARPKIADYPFTTLHPNLGVVRVGSERSFVIADIPGLIEGAAEGAGLGHRFLRHLQRTGVLLHLVDVAPFDENVDIVADAKAIVNELRKYDEALYQKPRWLVLNKVDMLQPEERQKVIKDFLKRFKWDGPVFEVSALNGEGCDRLCYAIQDYLDGLRKARDLEEERAEDPRFLDEQYGKDGLV